MSEMVLLGDEAVALAAVHAGLTAAYGYPGTPSTEILEYLIRHGRTPGGARACPSFPARRVFRPPGARGGGGRMAGTGGCWGGGGSGGFSAWPGGGCGVATRTGGRVTAS